MFFTARSDENVSTEQSAGAVSDDRVALVTGAAGGLGRAICDGLSAQGVTVYGADIAGEGVFHADLSTVEGNQAMIAHVIEQAGRLDTLVLNAGVQHVSSIDTFSDDQWARLRGVILDGPFYALRAAWSHLTKQRGGRVVVTATTGSYLAEKNKAGYISAKHGVMGLVRVAALEGTDFGLTANAVAPGWMDTPMLRGQLAVQAVKRGVSEEEVIAILCAEQPGNRFIELREVVAAIEFLASEAASAINGVILPIDLGFSVQG